MANSSNYRLLMEADLSTKKIEMRIAELKNKTNLVLHFDVDQSDIQKLDGILDGLRAKGNTIGKIKLFEDDKGGIKKAVIEYKNELGQIERITKKIDTKVKVTKERYIDQAKIAQQIAQIEKQRLQLTAKQADEMARAGVIAQKFLSKSTDWNTPGALAARDTAQQLITAVDNKDIDNVRRLTDSLKAQRAALGEVRTGWGKLTDSMKANFRMVAESFISFGIIYGAINQIKEAIQYVSDLNKEMVKIQVLQVEGAKTNEQIANLALQYNGLAKELGATTIQVAQGSVEWLRQGKTIGETQELLRSTMMLSKLGALESAQATEYLTSIMNGFKIETEDAARVVDRLISVDNISASSAGELATALSYTSAIANQSNVSFEKMVAMIAVVSSVTRISAETIGQALRHYISLVI